MEDKVTITKGTVQETLVFPLYGRYMANKMYPQLFKDTAAKTLMDRMDYDFSTSDMGKGPSMVYGMRLDLVVEAAKEYLQRYPDAIIVNLGCGLDAPFEFMDNGTCRYVNLDFPDVIELRERLMDLRDREMNLASDAMDLSWMDKIGADEDSHVFIFSTGVLFYFKPEDVRKLIDTMAKRFHGGCLMFDFENEKMVAKSNRMVRESGNKGAEMYYWLNDASREIPAYSDSIEKVDIMHKLPDRYSCIPFLYRCFFNMGAKKETMTFAKVWFR